MDVLSLTLMAQRFAALSGQDVRDIPTWVVDAMKEAYEEGYNVGRDDHYNAGYDDCRQAFLLRSQQFLFEFQLTPAFDAVKSYDFSANPRQYCCLA